MERVTVIINNKVSTKEDVLHLFEKSALNVERSIIPNWDALEEIVSDAVRYHGINVLICNLDQSNLDKEAVNTLVGIMNSISRKRGRGLIKIEGR